jgi:hypothetical protein
MKAALTIAAIAITARGLFVGWAMDQSIRPPSGGGWRCYAQCLGLTWAAALGVVGLTSLPAVCRRIADALSA